MRNRRGSDTPQVHDLAAVGTDGLEDQQTGLIGQCLGNLFYLRAIHWALPGDSVTKRRQKRHVEAGKEFASEVTLHLDSHLTVEV